MANKFLDLKRSQLVIAAYACERELLALGPAGRLQIKPGSKRDGELRKRRSELLEALRIKDQELIERFNKSGYPE